MANTQGFAYLAAGMVRRHGIEAVAQKYLTWINSKPTLATAENALLAAAPLSRDPDAVLVHADAYYAEVEHDPPTVTSITPNTGLAAGGTATVIKGTNLLATSAVKFGGSGGTNGTGLSVVDDTEVHVTSPAHTAGAVDVYLVTPDGNTTKTGGFTYT